MNHELEITAEMAATRAYQHVASRAHRGAQRQDLFDEAAQILQAQYDSGEIELDVSRAIRHELERADRKQGQAADRLVKSLRDGIQNLFMEGDPQLLTVVTLGGGLRISWKYVTWDDLMMMDQVRRDNLKVQQEAYDLWKENLADVRGALIEHGTVGRLAAHLIKQAEVAA